MAVTLKPYEALDTYLEQLERYRIWLKELREVDTPVAYGVVITPGVVGGSARIFNARVPVRQLVEMFLNGYSEDDVAEALPDLPPGAYSSALHYYVDHREEINRELHEEARVFASA